ncbi:MAG TPA: hypothetical protein VML91_10275 [Burkholderiales bacterium]|nr:hypothetical protein [Burkholderiales bacterium]
MNTMNNDTLKNEGSDGRLAGVVKAAIVCLLMAGAVLIGSGMHRESAVAADAPQAPATTDEAWTSGYFPAEFPAPQGAPEEPLPTF